MTKPAMSDAGIADLEVFVDANPDHPCSPNISRLIARIHAEIEARKQAEEDADLFHDEMERWKALAQTVPEACAIVREKTIRECAAIAGQLAAYHGLDIGDAGAMGCEEVQHAILSILGQKPC